MNHELYRQLEIKLKSCYTAKELSRFFYFLAIHGYSEQFINYIVRDSKFASEEKANIVFLNTIFLYPAGLNAINIFNEQNNSMKSTLIIKASKEIILTAIKNKGFKIYLLSPTNTTTNSYSLLSVFGDTNDFPLTITTHLVDEKLNLVLFNALRHSDALEIKFFDFNNNVHASYKVDVSCQDDINTDINNIDFINTTSLEPTKSEFIALESLEYVSKGGKVLSIFQVSLIEDLLPVNKDSLIITWHNIVPTINSKEPIGMTSTIIEEDPGKYQESDIALFLYRIFDENNIYLNPCRKDDNKEISDLLVVSQTTNIFIQAKDSINTIDSLDKPFKKKLSQNVKAFNKAVAQTRRTIKYIKLHADILDSDGNNLSIDVINKENIFLIVLQEIFPENLEFYQENINRIKDEQGITIKLLSYNELHLLTFIHQHNDSVEFLKLLSHINFGVEKYE